MNAVRGRLRRTFLAQIEQVLEKGQVKSNLNRQMYIRNLMKVEEAKDVCKDQVEGSLPTPMGNGRDVIYVCINC
jgi:hypothetical protein